MFSDKHPINTIIHKTVNMSCLCFFKLLFVCSALDAIMRIKKKKLLPEEICLCASRESLNCHHASPKSPNEKYRTI